MKTLPLKFNLTLLFGVLILLNLADAITTSMLVAQFGPSVEVNPVLRDLIQFYGVGALFGFKYFLISLLGVLLLALKTDRHIMVASYTLWFVNILYGIIAVYGTVLAVAAINT